MNNQLTTILFALLLATLALLFVAYAYAQDEEQDDEDENWELVTLTEPYSEERKNSSRTNPNPVVLGLLYNEDLGPETGVYALTMVADCTGIDDSFSATGSCTGYQLTANVIPFTFE